ncbi:MAG TPA: hypothetical protein VHB97_09650 [Polyangia bacterium]|nr:hypothetical protein [Polyangia bacterium]
MTTIELIDETLQLTVRGFDVVLALKKHLVIPLAHVTRADLGVAAAARERLHHSLRMPGTSLPGIVTAGSYVEDGRWMFWDIHSGDHAITIWIEHERYDAIVADVDDPAATVARINARLRR